MNPFNFIDLAHIVTIAIALAALLLAAFVFYATRAKKPVILQHSIKVQTVSDDGDSVRRFVQAMKSNADA